MRKATSLFTRISSIVNSIGQSCNDQEKHLWHNILTNQPFIKFCLIASAYCLYSSILFRRHLSLSSHLGGNHPLLIFLILFATFPIIYYVLFKLFSVIKHKNPSWILVFFIILTPPTTYLVKPMLFDYWQTSNKKIEILQVSITLLVGVAAFWNVLAIKEGQVTERFSKAVEHLSDARLAVRLGGIYALERISKDSPIKDFWTIIEILTAFVREKQTAHNFADAAEEGEGLTSKEYKFPVIKSAEMTLILLAAFDIRREARELREGYPFEFIGSNGISAPTNISAILDTYLKDFAGANNLSEEDAIKIFLHKIDKLEKMIFNSRPDQDVEAALAVIGRRDFTKDPYPYRNECGLSYINLSGIKLSHTFLHNYNFTGAILISSQFFECSLIRLNLTSSSLSGTILCNVDFQGSTLHKANFSYAILWNVSFNGADLSEVNFEGSQLYKVSFQGARYLTSEQLKQAKHCDATCLFDDQEGFESFQFNQ